MRGFPEQPIESAAVTYTVGQAAEFLGVSADTVRRLSDRGALTAVRSATGRRVFDGAQLAQYAASLRKTQQHERRESARNHFPGLVIKVTKDKVMAQVEIQSGPFRVVSLMSREAADELALVPGSPVVASVKSTNVVVEAVDH
jgi:molybdopterin-binding protein